MNKNYILVLLLSTFLTSCSEQIYKFVQVYEVSPVKESTVSVTDGGLIFENSDCALFYKFWSNGGNAGFEFYNKTDQLLYVDLAKSFFIENGIAYNYFLNREWEIGKTSSVQVGQNNTIGFSSSQTRTSAAQKYYLGDMGVAPTTLSNPMASSMSNSISASSSYFFGNQQSVAYNSSTTNTVSYKEEKILTIPPHSSKIISEYNITDRVFRSCDIESYPSTSATISYSEQSTPLTFSNIITYNKGEGTNDVVIENGFYISSITNFAEQEIIEFVPRDTASVCENMKHPDNIYNNGTKVYDPYIKSNVVNTMSTFYITYDVKCQKALYKKKYYMYWNNYLNGYTGSIMK